MKCVVKRRFEFCCESIDFKSVVIHCSQFLIACTLISLGDGVSYPVLYEDEDAETLLSQHEAIEIESDDEYHNDSTVEF